jgi:hypothetical protein
MEDKERQIRNELNGSYMHLTKELLMFDNINSFLALSRENTSVKMVALYPFDSAPGNYDVWDKAGQIMRNLRELKLIDIHFLPYYDDDDNNDNDGDEAQMPDWEIITRILPYVQRKIALVFSKEGYDADAEDIRGLARAIHGHPMISAFSTQGRELYLCKPGPLVLGLDNASLSR